MAGVFATSRTAQSPRWSGRFELTAWVPESSPTSSRAITTYDACAWCPAAAPASTAVGADAARSACPAADIVYLPANFALFACRRPQILGSRTRTTSAARRAGCGAPCTHGVSLPVREWKRSLVGSRFGGRIVSSPCPGLCNMASRRISGPRPSSRLSTARLRRCRPLPEPRAEADYALTVAHDYPHKDWDGLIDVFVRRADLPPLWIVGACRSEARLARCKTACGARCLGSDPFPWRRHGRYGLAGLYAGAAASSPTRFSKRFR